MTGNRLNESAQQKSLASLATQAATMQGMIVSLMEDFTAVLTEMPAGHARYRVLNLLDEAIRRDGQFIGRHPTTLFQCLWNAAWWYDSPEAADYYEPTSEGIADVNLYRLLERWRELKRTSTDRFFWLRLIQPPAVSLGSPIRAILNSRSPITGLAFSPDGQRIAGACYHHTVRIWEMASLVEVGCFREHEYGALRVAFSSDGQTVAVATLEGPTRLWDVASGRKLLELPGSVHILAYSPDGRWLAYGVWLRDLASGAERRFWAGRLLDLTSLTFSLDGRWLIGGLEDGTVRLWDTASGAEVRCLRGHQKEVLGVAVAGDRLISLCRASVLRVWSLSSGEEIRGFRCPSFKAIWPGFPLSNWLALSPDGRHALLPASTGEAAIWDLETGTEVRRLIGHEDEVTCVAYRPGGGFVATGSVDGTVRIWDLNRSSHQRRLKRQLRGGEFITDGRLLLDPRTGRPLSETEAKEALSCQEISPGAYLCRGSDIDAAEVCSRQTSEPVAWLAGPPGNCVGSDVTGRVWQIVSLGGCSLITLEEA